MWNYEFYEPKINGIVFTPPIFFRLEASSCCLSCSPTPSVLFVFSNSSISRFNSELQRNNPNPNTTISIINTKRKKNKLKTRKWLFLLRWQVIEIFVEINPAIKAKLSIVICGYFFVTLFDPLFLESSEFLSVYWNRGHLLWIYSRFLVTNDKWDIYESDDSRLLWMVGFWNQFFFFKLQHIGFFFFLLRNHPI